MVKGLWFSYCICEIRNVCRQEWTEILCWPVQSSHHDDSFFFSLPDNLPSPPKFLPRESLLIIYAAFVRSSPFVRLSTDLFFEGVCFLIKNAINNHVIFQRHVTFCPFGSVTTQSAWRIKFFNCFSRVFMSLSKSEVLDFASNSFFM